MRTEYRIFLVTFSLAFVALFTIHIVYLPSYWANASSQQGRPTDLYLPTVWTPAIIFYSVLIAFIPIVTFSLLSWLRKGKADEIIIFITTFFLALIVFMVFFALAPLRWGDTMHFGSTGFVHSLLANFFSFIGAVLSVAVFELNKLVHWARKRKLKAET